MVALQSDKRSLLELSEIADLTVKEQLQTIPDVSGVSIWGEKKYSMRLWLDPIKMSGYGITPIDIKNAVDAENVELPSGSIEGNTTELTIRTLGLMHTAQQFNDLIIKEIDGKIVRFSDIGRAELGPADIKSYMKMNGIPMVGVVVTPQPGANHIDIADAVYERMERMQKDLPDDVKYSYGFDNTRFIRASINEVKETVYIAFILVIIIIFLFLRDWRVTLVPCIVIPVSLIGAFFIMYIAGFSINVLSMLAVVLAVGLVVDDAIVMTENIYVRIEKGMSPKEAGIEGAKEIFFAVISTTITLVAVFFPIVFMDGQTGRLFREFSIVVSGSVIISSFAALTFTPMLATKLLVKKESKSKFYIATEPFFIGLNNYYNKSLNALLNVKWVTLPFVAVMLGLIVYLWSSIPAETAPLEDRSQININTSGAEGITYEYIRDYTEDINRLVDSIVPDAKAVTARVSSGSGNLSIILKDIKERDYSQMDVAEVISREVRKKTNARAFVQQTSSFGGRRGGMPIQYVLQTTNIEKLQEVLPTFLAKVYDNPTFQMADVNLKFSKPEVRIEINRDKANIMGVSTRNLAQVLQYGLSGQRMGYFYMNGKQYEILGEINRQQRNTPANLKSLYIRTKDGEMVQLDNLVDLVGGIAPPKLYRYNRFVSATVSAGLAKGKTIGQGLDEMDKIAKEVLDDTFRTALSGESKEYRESSSSLMFAFILAIVLIYLILAAQFESFKDPLIIMLTVPLAIAGALIFMMCTGVTMNIFSQIGIIMLIGLVAKNGILIVEFANQKQELGINKLQAIKEASLQRLRPILMTSVSTILGLLPLAFASGEGANQRIAMGITVVGGMLVSTILTMYVVPAIYAYISTDRSLKTAAATATK
jgi:multidrug efflux pump